MSKTSCGIGWESRLADQRAAGNADQAEFSAVVYGATNLESGIADDRIADSLDDYDVEDPAGVENWAREDAKFESATSDIGKEVARRITAVGNGYPFRRAGNRLEYTPSSTHVYEFCLAISQSPSITSGKYKELPRAFECLARDVLVSFLGDGAEGLRTGWPPSIDLRPTRFKAVVEHLHQRVNAPTDWTWRPYPNFPNDPSCRDVKDQGIDFVVWKSMLDGRDGHLFLLGQCACGDDWNQKFYDITPESLSQWINPISTASFLRVFTTPHHISNDAYFSEVNVNAGLTLDRARLTRFAESPMFRKHFWPKMKDSLKDLAGLVITSK